MAQLRTSLILDLVGNLSAQAARFRQNLKDLGSDGARQMKILKGASAVAMAGLDNLANRYTALLSGAAGAGALRNVAAFEDRLTMLQLNSNTSKKDMAALKEEIFNTAAASDIRVSPDGLLAGVEKIVEYTGDLQLAKDNLRNIGLVMRASGADGAEVGATLSDLSEKFKISSAADMLRVLDTLRIQGESGKFTLKDMAAQGASLTNTFASIGHTGKQAAIEMGAWSQVSYKATKSPEMAATALEALTRDIINNSDKINALKVQLWNPEDLKNGKYVARDLAAIVTELIDATKGDPAKLQKIFGAESYKVVSFVQANRPMLKDFLAIQGDGTEITRESAEAAKKLSAALEGLHASWSKLADSSLTGPLETLAGLLDRIDPATAATGFKAALVGGAVLGAAVLARKAFTIGQDIKAIYDRAVGGKKSVEEMIGKVGGAQPVYVVNWPGQGISMPGGTAGEAAAGGGAVAAARGLLSRITPGAVGKVGKLGAVAASAFTGYELLKTFNDDRLQAAEKINKSAGLLGGLGGGLAGMKLGAMAGTAVLPGIGTAVGGLAGGVLGGLAGDSILSAISNLFTHSKIAAELKVGFENAPPGMRVQQVSSSPNVDTMVSQGLRGVKP